MKRLRILLPVALFNIAFFYVLFELGMRYIGIHQLGSGQDITETMEKIDTAGVSAAAYAKQRYETPNERGLVFDVELGWDRAVAAPLPCSSGPCSNRFRILLAGDSVTQGVGAPEGEAWPDMLARIAPDRIEILNAAVRGYGIHQMYLKAKRELATEAADLLVFAYIDHDLLRPAAPYLWGTTQPVLDPVDSGMVVTPPEAMSDFIQSFETARSYFHIGVWLTVRSYQKRRYYFPELYDEYFKRVHAHFLAWAGDLATSQGIPVVILRLPQTVPFRGRVMLQDMMNLAWEELGAKNKHLSRAEIGPCVHSALKSKGIDAGPALNVTHPGAPVHAVYGQCVFERIVEPILKGVG